MKNGECKTSGDVIPSAFTDADTLAIIERCVATHLKTLPPSVKRVVLLGTADAYIKKTRTIFGRLYSNYTQVNEAAFRAGDALWVYAAHPSPGNGHFESWISGPPENVSARKRHPFQGVVPAPAAVTFAPQRENCGCGKKSWRGLRAMRR